ncbi:MAG: hypothetical protein QM753_14980 [Thermomicrobiales bacterium]
MTRRILVVGSPRDPTWRYTLSRPIPAGCEVVTLDIDGFATDPGIDLDGDIGGGAALRLVASTGTHDLREFDSCYARFIDPPPTDDARMDERCWARYRLLQLALAAAPFPVVNPPGAGESNDTKPAHTAMLGTLGFSIPRSCTTNDRDAAQAFIATCPHGAIYKSNSGQRSIVRAVGPDELDRLSLLDRCPVFFQERIHGTDIRVHVVGDRCHAVAIQSQDVDYRYDRSGTARETPFVVPDELGERCIRATAALGLTFSGIDVIQRDDSGEFVALEANPMPGYHGYDLTLGGAISASLWSWLAHA